MSDAENYKRNWEICRDELKDALSRLDAAQRGIQKRDEMRVELLDKLAAAESRLEACEAALRSFDVGRESSYWVGEVEKRPPLTGQAPGTTEGAHVHEYKPSALVPGEHVCSCGNYYVV